MYLQHTIAPGTANGGVCVRTPVPLSSRTLGFGFSPTYVTYFHRVYVDSIYPLSKESSVCVCVCVDLCLSLSLSPSNGGVCAPSPSPSLIPSFPIPFSLFFLLYPSLSLSLSMSYYHMSPTLLLLVSLILFPSAATEP